MSYNITIAYCTSVTAYLIHEKTLSSAAPPPPPTTTFWHFFERLLSGSTFQKVEHTLSLSLWINTIRLYPLFEIDQCNKQSS